MAIQRRHIGSRLSEVAIHGGVVHLSGQVPDDGAEGIAEQTRQVLGHIDRLLAEAGSDRSCILMCQIFLADIRDIDAMNAVWDHWVVPGHAPPRATVQARLARAEWLIEIVVTAAVEAVTAR